MSVTTALTTTQIPATITLNQLPELKKEYETNFAKIDKIVKTFEDYNDFLSVALFQVVR